MARYYNGRKLKDGRVTRIVNRKYGVFNVDETRVILIDPDGMWIPTNMYPIWGSKEGVVGTVIGVTDDLERLRIMWDNGTKNTFHLRNIKQYSEKNHGKPMRGVKPGPNTSFKIRKTYGNYGG